MGGRSRRGSSTGWESLTSAERRVATLVAEGLTYREIADRLSLSVRTVETHVENARAKLGASSRRGLAEEVRRRAPAKDER